MTQSATGEEVRLTGRLIEISIELTCTKSFGGGIRENWRVTREYPRADYYNKVCELRTDVLIENSSELTFITPFVIGNGIKDKRQINREYHRTGLFNSLLLDR